MRFPDTEVRGPNGEKIAVDTTRPTKTGGISRYEQKKRDDLVRAGYRVIFRFIARR